MLSKFILFFLIIASCSICFSQNNLVTVSGIVKKQEEKTALPYANVVLKSVSDSAFVTGTVTGDEGRFSLSNIKPGNYFLEISIVGYVTNRQPLYIGSLTNFLDMATIELEEETKILNEVVIAAAQVK